MAQKMQSSNWFSNWVFQLSLLKFFFRANWHWTYIKNELGCWLSSKVFICPQDKKANIFQRVDPLNPHQDTVINPYWSSQDLDTCLDKCMWNQGTMYFESDCSFKDSVSFYQKLFFAIWKSLIRDNAGSFNILHLIKFN